MSSQLTQPRLNLLPLLPRLSGLVRTLRRLLSRPIRRRYVYMASVSIPLAFLLITKRRVRYWREVFRSAYYALRSESLRNMFLFAALPAGLAHMMGLAHSKKQLFLGVFSVTWMLFYRFSVIDHGVARFKRTPWNVHVTEKAGLTRTPFYPVVWAFNTHAQTIVCFGICHLEWFWSKEICAQSETIKAFDGNDLQLDWLHLGDMRESDASKAFGDDSPVLLLIHGLGDDTSHPYMKRFTRMSRRHGWRTLALSYWRFDFGETRDVAYAVAHVRAKYPDAPIFGIGWSAGGHLLMKYLGLYGAGASLTAAVCVSGCFDFEKAVADVAEADNAAYSLFLGLQARVCARRHLENDKTLSKETLAALEAAISNSEVSEPMTLYNNFNLALGSFSLPPDVDPLGDQLKQHHEHNAISLAHNVCVPTLLLQADDDPVVSGGHVNWDKALESDHVILLRTRRGGHCSWYEGPLPFGKTWSDRVSAGFISTVLQTNAQLDLMRAELQKPDLDT